MKKFLALFLATLMLCSVFSASAADFDLLTSVLRVDLESGTVSLNDEALPVSVAPYINENGDTFIELKLLSEALGAEFSETEGNYTVSLSGVSMVYTPGSVDVKVAGQTIPMNSPVAVADNGTVMVPLRFAAEALGADVTYDGVRKEIVVIGAGTLDETVNYKLLFKYSGKTKIAHSKEHWRFEKTDDFDMADGFYEGMYDFAMGDIMFSLTVEKNEGDISLEQAYIQLQQSSNYTKRVLFDRGKGNKNGIPYAYAKHRSVDTIYESYVYFGNEYLYYIDIDREFESFAAAEIHPDVEAVLASFEFNYQGGDEENTVDLATIDLSKLNQEEELTEYTDPNYNWTIHLNGDWEVNDYYGFSNIVSVSMPTAIEAEEGSLEELLGAYSISVNPSINISTYSVIPEQSLTAWAAEERNLLEKTLNREKNKVSPVNDTVVNGYTAKTFKMETISGDVNYITDYYFLSVGEYRYAITLNYDKREEAETPDFLSSASSIIQSFAPGEINPAEVGKAYAADSDVILIDVLSDFKGEMFRVSHPCTWTVTETEGDLFISAVDMGYTSGTIDIISLLFPEMEFLFSAAGEVSIQAEKKSLSYYDDSMNKRNYTLEEYMYKQTAGTLNTSNSFFEVSLKENISQANLLGKQGYKTEIVVTAQGDSMHYTTYYLPYDTENVLIVKTTCADAMKNTVYEDALNRALLSLKLV